MGAKRKRPDSWGAYFAQAVLAALLAGLTELDTAVTSNISHSIMSVNTGSRIRLSQWEHDHKGQGQNAFSDDLWRGLLSALGHNPAFAHTDKGTSYRETTLDLPSGIKPPTASNLSNSSTQVLNDPFEQLKSPSSCKGVFCPSQSINLGSGLIILSRCSTLKAKPLLNGVKMEPQKDQDVEPSSHDVVARHPDGKWKAGISPNPTGENGLRGWQPYGLRIQKWLDLPVEELRRIATSPAEIKKLSVIDAVCVRHAANMLKGNDIRLEREAMLDRVQGKVKQTSVLEGANGSALFATKDIGDPPTEAEALSIYTELSQGT